MTPIEWNGTSVSFFNQITDVPFPLPGLKGPQRLFNIAWNNDGSLYTSYFGPAADVEEKEFVNGASVAGRISSITNFKEKRVSIHGSGEVRSFVRDETEKLFHLGYVLREITEPKVLAQHRLGGVNDYVADLMAGDRAKSKALVFKDLLLGLQRPYFEIHAAPEEYCPEGAVNGELVWAGRTRPMDNGRRLIVAVTLHHEVWPKEGDRFHELRVFAAEKMSV